MRYAILILALTSLAAQAPPSVATATSTSGGRTTILRIPTSPVSRPTYITKFSCAFPTDRDVYVGEIISCTITTNQQARGGMVVACSFPPWYSAPAFVTIANSTLEVGFTITAIAESPAPVVPIAATILVPTYKEQMFVQLAVRQ